MLRSKREHLYYFAKRDNICLIVARTTRMLFLIPPYINYIHKYGSEIYIYIYIICVHIHIYPCHKLYFISLLAILSTDPS